ncbi:MAG: hypothetical protein ABIH23_16635, partial [bacterium]
MMMHQKRDMYRGARKLIQVCAGVKPGEKVLVVTDTSRSRIISEAVYEAATEAGAVTAEIIMNPGKHPG